MIKTKVNLRLFFDLCILCGCHSDSDYQICPECLNDLPWLIQRCHICALPLHSQTTATLICADCQSRPPSYDKVRALFHYQFPVNQLIAEMKSGARPKHIRAMSQLLCQQLTPHQPPDAVIPLATHWRSTIKRGYNHAELMAQEIAQCLERPLLRQVLKKTRHTQPQKALDRKARLRNQKGTFICTQAPPANLILIDDVMTTGATAEAASQALKHAGAEHVEVWVIARTER